MNKRLKSDIEFLNDLNRIVFYEEGTNKSDKLIEEVYDYYNFIKDVGAGAIGLGKLGLNARKNRLVGDIDKSLKDLTKDNGFFQKIFYDPAIKNQIYNMFDQSSGKKALANINNTGKVKRGKDKSEILADAFLSKIENMSTKQMTNLKKIINPKKLEEDAESAVNEAELIKKAIESLKPEQKQLFEDLNDEDLVVGQTILDETKKAFENALIKQKIEQARSIEIVNEILGGASKELELIKLANESLLEEQKQVFIDIKNDVTVHQEILNETKTAFEEALIKQKIAAERSIKIVKYFLGSEIVEVEDSEEVSTSKFTTEQINDIRNSLTTTLKDKLIDFVAKAGTTADEALVDSLTKELQTEGKLQEDDTKTIITSLKAGVNGDENFTKDNIEQLLNTTFSDDEWNRFFDKLKPNEKVFKDLFATIYNATDKTVQAAEFDKLKPTLEKVNDINVSTKSKEWFRTNVENSLGADRSKKDDAFVKKIIDSTIDTKTSEELDIKKIEIDIESKQELENLKKMRNAIDINKYHGINWMELSEDKRTGFTTEIKNKFPNITEAQMLETLKIILPFINFPEDKQKEFILKEAISDINTKPEYKKLLDMASEINNYEKYDNIPWSQFSDKVANGFINEIKEKFPNITKENQTEILKTILPDIIFGDNQDKQKKMTNDEFVADINDLKNIDEHDKQINKFIVDHELKGKSFNDPEVQKNLFEFYKLLKLKGVTGDDNLKQVVIKLIEAGVDHNADKMIEESIINYIEVLKDVFDDLTEEELESKIREGLSLSEDYNIKRLLGGIE